MSLTLVTQCKLQRLIGAASNIQALMNDSTLAAAFNEKDADCIHQAVTAFDALTTAAALVQAEQKTASPFIRYRREILGKNETAVQLSSMVIHLYSGGTAQANLARLLQHADENHVRIALECLASYAMHRENDPFFMSLAAEIAGEMIDAPVEVAA